MNSSETNRADEGVLIDSAEAAFKRRQEALLKVRGQLRPFGNGQPTQSSLKALEEADVEWEAVMARLNQVIQEICRGIRV